MVTQVPNLNNGTNAIVVDDNKDLLDVFVELLQAHGINVMGSGANGKDAVELYQKFHPDVVFMDALMPKYDGFYGLEKIREYNPDAIVFLVTGSANIEKKIDKCNATAILEKPIDMNKIMNTINRFCTH
jgi:two-component system, chemotaxis family, chemotaxis protein CheY